MKQILHFFTAIFTILCFTAQAQVTEVARIDLGSNGSDNVMGIKIGPDGKVWFVDRTQRKLFRIDNTDVTNGDLSNYSSGNNTFTEIASGTADGLVSPVDLDFNPSVQNQLWVINQGTQNSGGSTVTILDAGTANQTLLKEQDGNAWHFMALATSMAFGDNGNWATAQGILDANRNNGNFTGPSLWSGDLSIYAQVGDPPTQTVNGSHLDMVHQSPYGMGIAHEKDNVYWVFDGYSDNVVRYDFVEPHYPGGFDHDDAIVRRYTEVQVERKGSLPAHMVLDKPSGLLFICDTDNGRILKMNVNTGSFQSNLTPANNETLAEYSQYTGVIWGESITGLNDPVGIDISSDSRFLAVSDNATNEIIIYNVSSITGFSDGPEQTFSFNVYPNPSNGLVKLDLSGASSQTMDITITSIIGNTVMQRRVNTDQLKTLDLSFLPKGIYQVSMNNDTQQFTQKLILN